MDGELLLHPTLGLNPRLCFCPSCRTDTDYIRQLGNRNCARTCPDCGLENFGAEPGETCRRCQFPLRSAETRDLAESEKIPGELCAECRAAADRAEKLVRSGGVFLYCKKCRSVVAISARDEMSIRARNIKNCPPPELLTVHVDSCPQCLPR